MSKANPRVHGIGGVFFKSRDPVALAAWYRKHLDFDIGDWGGARFQWQRPGDKPAGYTVWSPFKQDTSYLEPSDKPFMLNLRVDDLEDVLENLRKEGCNVLERREDGDYGKFGYLLDPEGTLLELWEPPDADPDVA